MGPGSLGDILSFSILGNMSGLKGPDGVSELELKYVGREDVDAHYLENRIRIELLEREICYHF